MIRLATPLEGMQRAELSLERTAGRIATMGGSPEGDSVDLSAEMVALIVARNSFRANGNVARAEDQMTRALLDVLG